MNKKSLFIRLGIVLAGIILGFGIAFGLEFYNYKQNSSLITNIENNDGIRLKQNKMATDTDRISIIAEVLPANARDKTVNWSIDWSNHPGGTNLDEYFDLRITDDTLTCTIIMLKPFSNQATLTCKSNMVPSIKSTCTVDYISRTVSSGQSETLFNGDDPNNLATTYFLDMLIASATASLNVSGGTIRPTVRATKNDITNFNLCQKQSSMVLLQSFMLTQSIANGLKYIDDSDGNNEDLISQMDEVLSCITFNYELVYNDVVISSGSTQFYFTLGFDISSFSVNSVNLDDTAIYF